LEKGAQICWSLVMKLGNKPKIFILKQLKAQLKVLFKLNNFMILEIKEDQTCPLTLTVSIKKEDI
jgi:hypothetical protein